ncbi:MAG: DNA polymerase I [Planctomycetes bacterium]|nr:DNA polymerase I [Planctomycetota bacterium]
MNHILFLIDGHAQIYRGYHALDYLASSSGIPTGAVFGFARMLADLCDWHDPDGLIAVFDSPGKTFRHQRYPDYKATRKPMPPDLIEQIPLILEVVDAYRIPIISLEGFEADDLIGTLARQAEEADWEVVLVTNDKDFGQLLTEKVRIYDPVNEKFIDRKKFTEKNGIPPERLVDVMGLWGDYSDNIPGVPGIGEKIGMQLIKTYGSLENLLAHADEIKGKRGESLRANRDLAILSKELATINRHAPIELDIEAARLVEPDFPRLRDIFARLDFHSLLGKLGSGQNTIGEGGKPELEPAGYHLVDDPDCFAAFLTELEQQELFAFDTETTGLDPLLDKLVGISFSWREGTGYYLPFRGPIGAQTLTEKELKRLTPIFNNPMVRKIGHNIRYDALVLHHAGINLEGAAFDTLIASSLADGHLTEHNLKILAKRYFNLDMTPIEELIGSGRSQSTMDLVPTTDVLAYASADADVSWRLHAVLDKRLDERGARDLFTEVEMPLSAVLTRMQAAGIRIDATLLARESAETGELLDALTKEIHALAGRPFNIASPKQLSTVLFEEMGLPIIRKTQTGASTDEAVLQELAHLHNSKIADRILEHRMYAKLKNTYLDALPRLINPETCRLHTSFSQVRTATGRLASSSPNLQNIPIRTERGRAIRAAFIPENGWKMLAADYSQVELRVLAAFSGDRILMKAFEDDQDIHKVVAAEVNGVSLDAVTKDMRSNAKAVNFGIIYGQGAHGLAASTGMSRGQAQRFIDGYFARFPRIRSWMDEALAEARELGYVETILKFRREIPDIESPNHQKRARAEREAINTIIQGSAADLIKTAMVKLSAALRQTKLEARLLLQIHDELLFECPPVEVECLWEIVRSSMEKAIPLSVPLKVDLGVGNNWLETK